MAWVASAVRILVLTTDVDLVVIGGGISDLGDRLLAALRGALEAQAATSRFLASQDLSPRVRLVPRGVPVAAVGAAFVGASRYVLERQ
jgi:predicted NBD/HSP70 family sugar kinase